ncbi:PKD domain-containing protein [uncultured Algibacter sp.]|uniref:immunoglobulin domain-containing protein n=1 Tax=uncultured Algibacter sp. TaxID=298659 RepID=UPI003216577E
MILKKIFFSFFVFLSISFLKEGTLHAQSIRGPEVVRVGQTYEYTINDPLNRIAAIDSWEYFGSGIANFTQGTGFKQSYTWNTPGEGKVIVFVTYNDDDDGNAVLVGLELDISITGTQQLVTEYCFQASASAPSSGGSVSYKDAFGVDQVLSGITLSVGVVSINSSNIPNPSGLIEVECDMDPPLGLAIGVELAEGNCFTDFNSAAVQVLYVDSSVAPPFNVGDIVYEDSALTSPFNAPNTSYRTQGDGSPNGGETLTINSSGVITEIVPCSGNPNNKPIANAGPDTTITLPTNTVVLNGSLSSDSDGNIVSYFWELISGDVVNIVNPNSVSTDISGLQEGTYIFQLTVTDNDGDTTPDRVTVTVNSSSTPDTCTVPQNERDALMALYNATDGANWTNTLANNKPWDINIPVCEWFGISVNRDYHVVGLNLKLNKLIGTIPTELGTLLNLYNLDLSNNSLKGNIPVELGNLSKLMELYLQNNELNGDIPSQLGDLSNINEFYLFNNQLSGNIPTELGNMSYTIRLNLSGNQLSGKIPVELAEMLDIEFLDLSHNKLIGSIPSEFSNLSFFEGGLSVNNNNLAGELPLNLAIDTGLERLSLENNKYLFKDLESVHLNYINILQEYDFNPQAKVDQQETITIAQGESYSIGTRLTSSNNHYQWQKSTDGGATFTDIGTDTNTFTITGATADDAGIYRFFATNDVVTGLTLERHTITVLVGEANNFCSSEWVEYPTIKDLSPSGNNILWYATETGGEPFDSNDEIFEIEGGLTYWWDDVNDSITNRTPVLVKINEGTPAHNLNDEFQFLPKDATIADLQMPGANIKWYSSAFANTPYEPNTPLIHGNIYYAEDVGTSTCRLEVEVYIGVLPPQGDATQFVCPSSTLNDITVSPGNGGVILWYATATSTTTLPIDTVLINGATYFATENITTDESFERTPITVYFSEIDLPIIPYPTQLFYSNQPQTIENLLAVGNDIKWYSQETGGNEYPISTPLEDGQTYYAQQTQNGCTSARAAIKVSLLSEEAPTIIGCEKFKPQLGDHYVISGWLKEQVVKPVNPVVKNFNNSPESKLFIDLLNHLKDNFLSGEKYKQDFPKIYIPKSKEENLNFDALTPFVNGITPGEKKLVVYDFSRVEDKSKRAIGFSFYLNKYKTHLFEYKSPEIDVQLCASCLAPFQKTISVNYPIQGQGNEILNFTQVQVNNNALNITQSFNASSPIKNEVSTFNISSNTGNSGILESITVFDYEELENQQPIDYLNGKIQLEYSREDGSIIDSQTLTFSTQGDIIDGWQRVIGEFTVPDYKDDGTGAALLNIKLLNVSNDVNVYFDDIRVHPFDSNMKTFVYHPITQRLMSELDENNYATFYEYDAEGGLVRVKKETAKGIYTIQETRSGNIKAGN